MEFNIYQRKAINASEPHIVCLSPPAAGKALPNTTIIPTPDGPKTVGEIQVGDYLFDRRGNPTKVLGVYPQGMKEVYEITFGDGRKSCCCKEHIWRVHKKTWTNKNEYRNYTVSKLIEEKILENNGRTAQFYIPVAHAVKYSEKSYQIHPYIIGAFLGDGCCLEKYLTFSSQNNEIPNHIAELLNIEGAYAYKYPANNYSWGFKDKNNKIIHTSILPEELINYSRHKKIPKEYKYGSIEQRLQLLQGLFDTDGSISKDKRENHAATATMKFTSVSWELIKDVQEVMGSLGYITSITEDSRSEKYTTGKCYTINCNIPNGEKEKMFWVSYKKQIALEVKNKKQNRHYDRTTIRSIKSLNYQTEMTCFYVDNEEHLFLTNDFIVTHNTTVLTERVRHLIQDLKVNPKDIVAITFTRLAAEEMRKRLNGIAEGAFIGTIHSYANTICLSNGIDTSYYLNHELFDEIVKKAVFIPASKYPKVQHLLVDEFQDVMPQEFLFLSKIGAENTFFVGDDRQSIYQFRGSNDKYLRQFCIDPTYAVYNLRINYRNTPDIVNFAEDFLGSYEALSPSSKTAKTETGYVCECKFNDALDALEEDDNWGSWFILCRTNNQIVKAQELLEERGIKFVTFKKGDLDDSMELENLLNENRVKILTIHTAKGLEAQNVIVTGAKTFNEEERKISYVAATRAENTLYWCPGIAGNKYKKDKPQCKAFAGRRFDKTTTDMVKF